MRLLPVIIVAAGCSFEPLALNVTDGQAPTVDAAGALDGAVDAAPTDAGPDAFVCVEGCAGDVMTTCTGNVPTVTDCALGCDDSGDPPRCFELDPQNGLGAVKIGTAAVVIPDATLYVFDTDTGAITTCDGTVIRAVGTGELNGIVYEPTTQTTVPDIGVFAFRSLRVPASSGIRAIGVTSFAILVAEDVVIEGSVVVEGGVRACSAAAACGDVTASSPTCPGPGGGFGGDQTLAGEGPGGGGLGTGSSGLPERGGGGGGFGSVGGAGGSAGGAGGAMYAGPTPLIGGSGGGGGGANDDLEIGGPGGGGGGALQISAPGGIRLAAAAAILAGGGGGGAGAVCCAGGGGGSGGLIVLDGASVVLDAPADLAANGGGGGGGANAVTASGATGGPGTIVAAGGPGLTPATSGGDGAAGTSAAEAGRPLATETELDGGGGGGGGFGRIFVFAREVSVAGSPVSPAPVVSLPAVK